MPGTPDLELPFSTGHAIDEPGEVALEDYARVLLKAGSAEAIRDPADARRVTGIRVAGLSREPTPAALVDLEDFARSLVADPSSGGLGWS